MLSAEENELITRVGPGTPMGRVMREFWLPLVLAEEVEADGAPVRVRLLGEDLLAFRDSEGNVGLVGAYCPHRLAPMFFGRNEECGLRCVYHGWKFDRSGACVDMPSEPPDSLFKLKVTIAAYPCRERNGIVWTYMGPRSEPPELPSIEWGVVPPSHRRASKRIQYNNWLQALEGGIDPAHSGFLHKPLDTDRAPDAVRDKFYLRQVNPSFEILETDYGLQIGTRRGGDETRDFWSITQFMLPFCNAFSRANGKPDPSVGGFAWVPMDDHTTMVWCFTWNPARPMTAEERADDAYELRLGGGVHLKPEEYLPPVAGPEGPFRPVARRENDYFVDRAAQKTKRFSGVPGLSLQDVSLQEGMGPVCDRTREHLGTSDTAIIAARRVLLRAANAMRETGTPPPAADAGASFRVRAVAALHPKGADWTEAAREWIHAEPGATAPAL